MKLVHETRCARKTHLTALARCTPHSGMWMGSARTSFLDPVYNGYILALESQMSSFPDCFGVRPDMLWHIVTIQLLALARRVGESWGRRSRSEACP